MPLQPPCPLDRSDQPLASADPAALGAQLAATARDPWRASLFMRRLATLRQGLDDLRAWLEALPRRLWRATARRWAAALPAAALILALAAGSTQAASITVGAGGCTLADAITAANTDTATGGCPAGSGADTIGFNAVKGIYGYTSALPDITTDITIQGNVKTTIQRTGGGAFAVLTVQSGDLTLNDVTISGGSTTYGGGIVVRGTLAVTDSVISGNSANFGGGIYGINGTIFITDSVISGNSAGGAGGGVWATNGAGYNASVNLTRTTVSGNSARNNGGGTYSFRCSTNIVDSTLTGNTANNIGGGMSNYGSGISVSGSTISGNAAGTSGGGLVSANDGTVSLTNTTVSGNTAGNAGGGIRNLNAVLRLRHSTVTGNSAGGGAGGISSGSFGAGLLDAGGSIIAGQVAGADCANSGTFTSSGYNLEGGTSCGFTMAGDIQNGSADLGPLQDNGGPTFTHALGAASDARDAASNAMCAAAPVNGVDQRGVLRPQNVTCDIGAFEAGAFTLNVVVAGAGSGTVSSAPAGIACPGTCSAGPIDGQVGLTPAAAPGSVFAGWGGDCAGRGATVVAMAADRSCTATFDIAPTLPTAADVLAFTAAPDPTGRVRIAWETASEVDVAGFRVERAASADGQASPPGSWAVVGSVVPARGSAAGGASYAVMDAPGMGRFAYRLTVLDAAGAPRTHGPALAVVRALRAFLPIGWRAR